MIRLFGVLLVAVLIVASVGSQASRFQINARGPVSMSAPATVVVPEQPRTAPTPAALLVSFDIQIDEGDEREEPVATVTPEPTSTPTASIEPEPVAEIETPELTAEPAIESTETPVEIPTEEPEPLAIVETAPTSEPTPEETAVPAEPEAEMVPDWWETEPTQAAPTEEPVATPEPTPVPTLACPVEATVWFSHLVIDRAGEDVAFRVRVELPPGYDVDPVSQVMFVVQPDARLPDTRMVNGRRDGGMFGGVFSLSGEELDFLLAGLAGEVRIEVRGATNGCNFAGASTIEVIDTVPDSP